MQCTVFNLYTKLQECGRILPADVFHDLSQHGFVRRVLAAFDQLTEFLAKDAAVILMAREGAERARVGQHTDGLGKQVWFPASTVYEILGCALF